MGETRLLTQMHIPKINARFSRGREREGKNTTNAEWLLPRTLIIPVRKHVPRARGPQSPPEMCVGGRFESSTPPPHQELSFPQPPFFSLASPAESFPWAGAASISRLRRHPFPKPFPKPFPLAHSSTRCILDARVELLLPRSGGRARRRPGE